MRLFYNPFGRYQRPYGTTRYKIAFPHTCTLLVHFSQSVRMLGLIRIITYPFSSVDSLLILYLTLVRPKLECASNVWSSTMSTEAKQLERNQRKFLLLWQYRFFAYVRVTYEDFPQFLDLHIWHSRRHYLDALSFISVYSSLECCSSVLDITDIRVLLP